MPLDSLWSLELWLHHHELLLDLVVLEVKAWLSDFFLSKHVNITKTGI
jgi:hypothetical protein